MSIGMYQGQKRKRSRIIADTRVRTEVLKREIQQTKQQQKANRDLLNEFHSQKPAKHFAAANAISSPAGRAIAAPSERSLTSPHLFHVEPFYRLS